MSASTKNNNSQTINIALIIAGLLLVVLIVYGNRFHSKTQETTNPLAPNTADETVKSPVTVDTTYKQAPSFHSPLKNVRHPSKNSSNKQNTNLGVPSTPSKINRIAKAQSNELRSEATAESMRPEEKRSLTLSEEEIQELENSGRMIF